MFDIAIIIINYNYENLTLACVESVTKRIAPRIKYQLTVVDNGSKEKSYRNLKTYFEKFKDNPAISLIRSNINIGFGGGHMMGIQQVHAKYYTFLNSDVILHEDCFSDLIAFMDSHPEVGVCTPQMLSINGKAKKSFNHFLSPIHEIFGRGFLEIINPKLFPSVKKSYSQPLKVAVVAGSFLFFRAVDFHQIGGFDTNIFLYHEETDLCKRLKSIGKTAYLVPSTTYKHDQGGSTTKSEKIKRELIISRYYVMKKHYTYLGFILFWVVDLVCSFFKLFVKPKQWKLFFLKLNQAHLKYSLKQQQRIRKL